MADEVHSVSFDKKRIHLEMEFEGDNYETATVRFGLKAFDKRPPLEENVAIPVKCLFDMGYLINMSLRRAALQYEMEVMEMQDKITKGKHPFKHIHGGDNEKD